MYSLYQIFALFLIYAFLGWCVEVSFVAVTLGQVVNRGFLNGPLCPIYGVGMMGVLLLEPVSQNLLLLFFGGLLLCSVVELVGGWVLEQVFHTRWWDYTDEPFNLGGYVCLRFSIMWGLAVVFAVRLIHPMILRLVNFVPHTLGIVLLAVLYGLFAVDMVMTLVTIIGLKRRMGELERVADGLHTVGDAISGRLGTTAVASAAKLDELKESGQEKMAAALESGQAKVSAAVESGQEKMAAAIESSQEKMAESREKLEARVTETLQELYDRRAKLEARQQAILQEFRNHPRFGTRRLGRAFPNIRQVLQEHFDSESRE